MCGSPTSNLPKFLPAQCETYIISCYLAPHILTISDLLPGETIVLAIMRILIRSILVRLVTGAHFAAIHVLVVGLINSPKRA